MGRNAGDGRQGTVGWVGFRLGQVCFFWEVLLSKLTSEVAAPTSLPSPDKKMRKKGEQRGNHRGAGDGGGPLA